MRIAFFTVALAALSGHAHAGLRLPAPGLYCPVIVDAPPISVGARGVLGIDLLDCEGVRLARGRARAEACFANGGARVALDTDLVIRQDGTLLHDGVTFRLYTGPRPCPVP
ncbi:hypothetical protein [Methylorubrum extorquens]|uniref:Uncharacterized protein n=1 Tax=Methylorubrum extorquens (strain ATCC 14718 / DSM 1338 / JCM 2805 / NCIMB 9133 / AM1) TaxID=272630 RepID=C5B5Z0_METEA|nr:hypothetical protein [Methylorubrum extorquens]ACS43872.1 Hypothetical protein MexAM1_META2p1095 [Methylorubrum extorquens AM1]MCP1546279.1 hypothetical protein [Methylorubrum extorquens]MCP1590946.1 hypothetical protein [Methylorubrum extorquens]